MATDSVKVAQNAPLAGKYEVADRIERISVYARPEPNLAIRLDALESRVARLEAVRVAFAKTAPVKAAIIGALSDGMETSHEISMFLGKSYKSVGAYLSQLAKEGSITRCSRPFYRDPLKKNKSVRYKLGGSES